MKKFLIVVFGLLLVCQFPLLAKDHGRGKEKQTKVKQQKAKENKGHGKFSQDDQGSQYQSGKHQEKAWKKSKISHAEKQVLKRHYLQLNYHSRYGYYRNLPPGLAKRLADGKGLPPGWRNKIIIGEILPTEIYYQTNYLPVYIIEYLPPQPEGTQLVVADGKIIRLIEATKTIIDVFDIRLP
ncbi:MAG: hypothetical protein KKB51_11810 [Candidatus Riflebacteria bacterium]|nr:hypothetical protein [Candidatus Riflebacteria bacterium]